MDSSYGADQSQTSYLRIGGALVVISSILTLVFVIFYRSYYEVDYSRYIPETYQSLLNVLLFMHVVSGGAGILGGTLALLKTRYRLSLVLCLASSLGLAFMLSLAGSALVAISKNDFSEARLKKNVDWLDNGPASGDQLEHSIMARRGG
ncbi:MAG: hypothetical protein KKE24_03865 [Candidatus Thermoplasmatota archaeon]|nr:hypothetical protein [Candidatus Thermoplasmatota archaeon]